MSPTPFNAEASRNGQARFVTACFGVACPQHGRCARYAAVDRSEASPTTIGTCLREGVYPLFIALVEPDEALCA